MPGSQTPSRIGIYVCRVASDDVLRFRRAAKLVRSCTKSAQRMHTLVMAVVYMGVDKID